jgi:hypothetical protein
MVLDTVITIVNYDRHMFIVQATGFKIEFLFIVGLAPVLV